LTGRGERAIGEIRAIPIDLPLRRDWRWRGLSNELGHWVLVRLETGTGAVGWGEATPLADWGGDFGRYYGETPSTVCHVIEEILGPAIRDADIWDVAGLSQRVSTAIRGHPYARAAVDMAIWDARGRLSGEPVFRLLGGSVRSRVRVAHMLGLMPSAEAVEEGRAALAEGTTAFQVKLAGDPSADAEAVSAIRDALGPAVTLRVDLNQGYGGLPIRRAIACVRELERAGADLVEQPVEGLANLAAVRAAVDVPIVADESCWTSADLIDLVRAESADAISVYVAKAGGLREAHRVASMSEAYGLACDVNGSLESGIGTLASLQLAAACPGITLPAVISCPAAAPAAGSSLTGRYYEDDVLVEPVAFEGGCLVVPDGPGLGIAVSEDKVRDLATAAPGR
jgi:muconate cycloisomerase